MRSEAVIFVSRLVEQETGIHYPAESLFQLENRLESIASELKIGSVEELVAQLRIGTSSELRVKLIDAATNNETSFFRDPKVYSSIKTHVLPQRIKEAAGHPLKIWSAACSYGQEPYSLAMILAELGASVPALSEITATDLARKAIARASTGRYSQLEIERGVPPELLAKYFHRVGESWEINASLRSIVRFEQMNLLSPKVNGPFDLVLCRNILIYQKVENKTRMVKSIGERMRAGGVLILGAGESLIGVSNDFDQMNVDGVFMYQKK